MVVVVGAADVTRGKVVVVHNAHFSAIINFFFGDHRVYMRLDLDRELLNLVSVLTCDQFVGCVRGVGCDRVPVISCVVL